MNVVTSFSAQTPLAPPGYVRFMEGKLYYFDAGFNRQRQQRMLNAACAVAANESPRRDACRSSIFCLI